MKRFVILSGVLLSVFLYGQSIMDMYVITSLFGDSRKDHFHTGIDLFAVKEPLRSYEDTDVVFFNKKRKSDLLYGNGDFILLQNTHSTFRYNYSHIEEGSVNYEKKSYSAGEIVALTGNSGRSTGYHLHLEVEDLINNRLVNPINLFQVKDTMKPVIEDVYFVTLAAEKISLYTTKHIVRGGKLFIKAYDKMDTTHFSMVPYSIKVFINGSDFYSMTLSGLDKVENDLYVTDTDKNFYSLYPYADQYVFYIKEKYFLPGLYGIKIEVSDYSGNKAVFNTSFRVMPPS